MLEHLAVARHLNDGINSINRENARDTSRRSFSAGGENAGEQSRRICRGRQLGRALVPGSARPVIGARRSWPLEPRDESVRRSAPVSSAAGRLFGEGLAGERRSGGNPALLLAATQRNIKNK